MAWSGTITAVETQDQYGERSVAVRCEKLNVELEISCAEQKTDRLLSTADPLRTAVDLDDVDERVISNLATLFTEFNRATNVVNDVWECGGVTLDVRKLFFFVPCYSTVRGYYDIQCFRVQTTEQTLEECNYRLHGRQVLKFQSVFRICLIPFASTTDPRESVCATAPICVPFRTPDQFFTLRYVMHPLTAMNHIRVYIPGVDNGKAFHQLRTIHSMFSLYHGMYNLVLYATDKLCESRKVGFVPTLEAIRKHCLAHRFGKEIARDPPAWDFDYDGDTAELIFDELRATHYKGARLHLIRKLAGFCSDYMDAIFMMLERMHTIVTGRRIEPYPEWQEYFRWFNVVEEGGVLPSGDTPIQSIPPTILKVLVRRFDAPEFPGASPLSFRPTIIEELNEAELDRTHEILSDEQEEDISLSDEAVCESSNEASDCASDESYQPDPDDLEPESSMDLACDDENLRPSDDDSDATTEPYPSSLSDQDDSFGDEKTIEYDTNEVATLVKPACQTDDEPRAPSLPMPDLPTPLSPLHPPSPPRTPPKTPPPSEELPALTMPPWKADNAVDITKALYAPSDALMQPERMGCSSPVLKAAGQANGVSEPSVGEKRSLTEASTNGDDEASSAKRVCSEVNDQPCWIRSQDRIGYGGQDLTVFTQRHRLGQHLASSEHSERWLSFFKSLEFLLLRLDAQAMLRSIEDNDHRIAALQKSSYLSIEDKERVRRNAILHAETRDFDALCRLIRGYCERLIANFEQKNIRLDPLFAQLMLASSQSSPDDPGASAFELFDRYGGHCFGRFDRVPTASADDSITEAFCDFLMRTIVPIGALLGRSTAVKASLKKAGCWSTDDIRRVTADFEWLVHIFQIASDLGRYFCAYVVEFGSDI